MRNNFIYLNDKKFLDILFSKKVKNHYAKISLLDFKTEDFSKNFVGKVTAGTVTLSATSAVRRTCSLTVVTNSEDNDLTNIDNDISLNKKFQLMVGYDNDLVDYQHYGKIIWFPLGVYVFTNVAITKNSSGTTINVTGKDKMCLLNGEIAGELYSSTNFTERIIMQEDGSMITEYPTIFQIVQEAVNHLGGEPLNNIVINDLPREIKRPLKYTGTDSLYYGVDKNNKPVLSISKDGIENIYREYRQNDIIGYKYEDFVFPGDLILDAGSNVAEVLKQICDKLGNYEYFYDINGVFIFQEIKNYMNTSYSSLLSKEAKDFTVNFAEAGQSLYKFNESEYIISYSNTPNFENIKNDIWVWGVRNEIPIRYHIAIDTKPNIIPHNVIKYKNKETGKTLLKPWTEGVDKDEDKIVYYPSDWRCELYLRCLENARLGLDNYFYYAEMVAYFPSIYDFDKNDFTNEVKTNPSSMTYFLDFIDPREDSLISKFSVDNIGRRSKAISDENITILYNNEIVDIVITDKEDKVQKITNESLGQKSVCVPKTLFSLMEVTSIPLTAYDRAREMLQQYTNFKETVSINAIPLYFLEPNTRVTINNNATGIHGDYIIQTLNMPLAASGQMTLTASAATMRL